VVNADGSIAHASSPSIAVEHVGTGVYEVTFGQDVSGCAYEATTGFTPSSLSSTMGVANVSGDTDGDSPNDVTVRTFINDGTSTLLFNLRFHLTVTCKVDLED
jgi:hypothetical protein